MATLRLQIVTAQRTVFDEQVDAVTLPGEEGYFGMLANHAPIVAVLTAGSVTVRRGQKEDVMKVDGGFVEMSNNSATLLPENLTGIENVAGAKLGRSEEE